MASLPRIPKRRQTISAEHVSPEQHKSPVPPSKRIAHEPKPITASPPLKKVTLNPLTTTTSKNASRINGGIRRSSQAAAATTTTTTESTADYGRQFRRAALLKDDVESSSGGSAAEESSTSSLSVNKQRRPRKSKWSPLTVPTETARTTTPPPATVALPSAEQRAKIQPFTQLSIDGALRTVRFYGEVAVAFMRDDGGDPREIVFQSGQRRVLINNSQTVSLAFNDSYRPVHIADTATTVQMRFGTPLRELYINGKWYDCFFGEPAARLTIDQQQLSIQIEGPAPQIQIGPCRSDLVLGTISLIVDSTVRVLLYLDTDVQHFWLDDDSSLHSIQFADYFQTVLLDGHQLAVEYGAMPKRVSIGGRIRYIRFTVLPGGLDGSGHLRFANMLRTDRSGICSPPPLSLIPSVVAAAAATNPISMPVIPDLTAPPPPIVAAAATAAATLNIDDLLQKLVASGILNSGNTGAASDDTKMADIQLPKHELGGGGSGGGSSISTKPIDLSDTKGLKQRFAENVAVLFAGMQCASCGVRFPADQTVRYSQHLDWHFRQNRRDRELSRRAQSRGWYYKVADWVQYEEIEDLDDREKNWFEQQNAAADQTDNEDSQSQQPSGFMLTTSSAAAAASSTADAAALPSCVADSGTAADKTCDMCHDPFEMFYNEEMEDWHLRNAIRVDENSVYHPACLEELEAKEVAAAAAATTAAQNDSIDNFDDNAVDMQIAADEDEKIIVHDDDEEVIVLPDNETVIEEIPDDDEDDDVPIKKEEESTMPPPPPPQTDEVLNYEPIGEESDIQILVPQVDTLNLDEYEEKELPEVDGQQQQQQQLPVKIKEEPIDDGYRDVLLDGDDEIDEFDDFFEAVGSTFEQPPTTNEEHVAADDDNEGIYRIDDGQAEEAHFSGNIICEKQTIFISQNRNVNKNLINKKKGL